MTELLEGQADGRTANLGSTAWRARLLALEQENAQLRQALSSRIVIEQAKGVLTERFSLDPDRAFELLRRAARSSRRPIHALAAEVITSADTPAEIQRVASTLRLSTLIAPSAGARGRGR